MEKIMNFNRKCIYHAPQICMYCKTCYGVKPGFRAPFPTHGICDDCFPRALSLGEYMKVYLKLNQRGVI